MKKKCTNIISLLICLVLILPTSVFAGQPTADYSGHWADKQIKSFLDMGFIALGKDGNFNPDGEITRAEFAAMTNKAFAFIEKDVKNFKDVNVNDAFYNDMLIAKKAGYLSGLPDGTVNPKGYMSRQEYAVIISRLLKLDTNMYIAEADKYADASVLAGWSKGAVGAAAKFGYMQGEPGGIFSPKGFVTRGQAVAVLERCYLASVKAVYSKAGTYSGGVVEGNAAINAPDVTLENTTINGNLIIGEAVGNGNAKLKNVTVKGDTIVKGGGLNSIIIEDSKIKNIIITKEDNKVRVVAVGKTTVEKVDMQSGGKLEEQGTTGSGFGYVTIAESLDSNEPVILAGSFETVQVMAAGIKLNAEAGSIVKLEVAKTAEATKINLGTGVKVAELVVQSKAEVTGSGTISKADVAVQGVVITAPTTTITAAAGVNVATSLPGQAPDPTPSASTGGSTGSSGGSGRGGSGSGGGSQGDDDDRNTTVEVSGVTLNRTTMTLTVGKEAGVLAATVAPANATDKNVTWSSDNEAVASVANGIVTPVGAGTATITVTTVDGGKTATCIVTVNSEGEETEIDYLPNFMAGFISNINRLNFEVAGELIEPIAVNKLRYITSETGEHSFTLSDDYEMIDGEAALEPGQYFYYSYGSHTSVSMRLTDSDADAIKGLIGFGNNAVIVNGDHDRLVAEDGWYPYSNTGAKPISISKKITYSNDSGIEVAALYCFDKNDAEMVSYSIADGFTNNINIDSQTTNIIFYSGTYTPGVKPTSGKMKIVPFDFDYTNGIILDNFDWIDVTESNFGPGASGSNPEAVTGVTLNRNTLALTVGGDAGTLIATVEPDSAVNKNVTWSSDNEAVATVADGIVTPVGAGTATITVTTVDGGKTAACEVTVNAIAIDFLPPYQAELTANINLLTFRAGGLLTEDIDLSKIKYVTSRSGDHYYNLADDYSRVEPYEMAPGNYWYSKNFDQTIIYLELTENDANAIKGLTGYGNDYSNLYDSGDGLVAESGWYPGAETGAKGVYINNEIYITNNTGEMISGIYQYDANDVLFGPLQQFLDLNETDKERIDERASNIIFYIGTFSLTEPTSGKMKIVPVNEELITNGIALDESGWIDVDATNFGPEAP